jgi:DNA invertase Pin-like site-specific DNA recombinase
VAVVFPFVVFTSDDAATLRWRKRGNPVAASGESWASLAAFDCSWNYVLAALLDYARPGDAIVVVGIDRLGRNAAEVMMTIRDLAEHNIVLRSLREGIDTSNATGRMVAGVLASLAELELELGRERRTAAREARRARGQHIGRPKALDEKKAALAVRMHASGESASTIANTLGVSRATVYRVLAEQPDE